MMNMPTEEPEDPPDGESDTVYYINGYSVPISSLKLDLKRAGEVIAHRESGDIKQASDSTVQPDGAVVSHLRGRPAQGEGATEDVCRALARTVRSRGFHWHVPTLAEPHDDCDCVTASLDADSPIRIQVVRADSTAGSWRALARDGEYATLSESAADPADVLRDSISKKADRTAIQQRRELILALDATATSWLALGPVVRAFRTRHGAWAGALEFSAIWLVGPSANTTYRLDCKDTFDSV